MFWLGLNFQDMFEIVQVREKNDFHNQWGGQRKLECSTCAHRDLLTHGLPTWLVLNSYMDWIKQKSGFWHWYTYKLVLVAIESVRLKNTMELMHLSEIRSWREEQSLYSLRSPSAFICCWLICRALIYSVVGLIYFFNLDLQIFLQMLFYTKQNSKQ